MKIVRVNRRQGDIMVALAVQADEREEVVLWHLEIICARESCIDMRISMTIRNLYLYSNFFEIVCKSTAKVTYIDKSYITKRENLIFSTVTCA